MKKTKIFLPVMALGLMLSMGLAACNQNNSGNQSNSSTAPSASTPAKEKITIEKGTETLSLEQDLTLTASVAGVTWESSDATIATVTSTGDKTAKVHALSFGDVTITAKKEGYTNGSISLTIARPQANATFDLTTAADHYSADGWWELPSGGFAMQTVLGWCPIAQQISWGQTEEPAETFIGGFGTGDKETVTFTSSKAIKGELLLNIGNSDEVNLADIISIKLNGTAIDLTGKTLEAHAGDYGNSLEFGEVTFGNLNFAASNTLVFEFLADTNVFLNEVQVFAGDATVTLTAPTPKQQIAVTKEALEVIVGQTVAIQTAVQGVSYVSIDSETASVNASGVVTGVKPGITHVTVKKEGMYSVRVEITVKPAPVAGQILVEAEDALELAGEEKPSGVMIQKDGQGGSGPSTDVHSGSAYVMIFSQESELVFTYKFNATSAGKMTLSVVGSSPMSMGGEAAPYVIKDSMAIKLNDATVTAAETAEFPAPEGYSSAMAEATIGDVNVKAGENTLVITLTSPFPSLDVFKLTAK